MTPKERKSRKIGNSIQQQVRGKLRKKCKFTHTHTSNLISFSCSVCWEARLMPSQRSRSLLLHTGGGTNWCTLGATGPRGARLDAKSSLRTSGTFCTSACSSPSEEESHADFWELKKSLSRRRMMFGEGDLTFCSSIVGGLRLEMGWRGKVISKMIKNPSCLCEQR